ncbi:hypothetical protein TTHERM_00138340 (macronuclear) [Tetrahymena thermophila SB210]|uniref:Uncharacterized protein n=1 Tax=Tetrahymena thermophila (strain SB210) TaxID=312017 RepID=I7M294_TETTS|nr:hypothetical protein TTHERM_00138340 [Tetrahymena thermophila SB210]EAR99571.3 hypothetical protein TTHERM_00138340 [Tetrahymena thermophila SB210]|eukprot:XP_001019816.3 hypothetical protein TTHERM_00138340 [Tetrahymena thermophila SB210]
MRGIGWNLDRQTKIKILQDRAYKYNDEFDELESQGQDPDQIRVNLLQKEYQKRHENEVKRTLPFDETQKVISVNGATDLGFDQAHKTKSATKQMYETMEQKIIKRKENRLLGKKNSDSDLAEKYKQQDEQMKKKIYQDHLNELFSNDYKKVKDLSNYQQNFQFTQDMQNDCDNQNFDHHQRKNDLKWYQEAYIKYKSTMRK